MLARDANTPQLSNGRRHADQGQGQQCDQPPSGKEARRA